MKRVNLFFLDSPSGHGAGGVLTALIHHYFGFRSQGYETGLYRVTKKSKVGEQEFPQQLLNPRPDLGTLRWRYASVQEALSMVPGTPSIIMFASQPPRRYDPLDTTRIGYCALELARHMIACGALFMIHSTWEIGDHEIDVLRSAGNSTPAVVGRHRYRETLAKHGVNSTLIPLMFNRSGKTTTREFHAVSQTRIAAGKNIDVLVQANDLIKDATRQIRVYGYEARQYIFRTLDPKFPHWRRYYHGRFDADSPPTARAKFMVDMTFGNTFSTDGGGPQMTFLEAWDRGVQLVIHQNWLTGGPDDITEAMVVDSPESLAAIASREPDPYLIEMGYERLRGHLPETTVPQFERLFAERM